MSAWDAGAFWASVPATVAAVVALLGVTFLIALKVGRHAVIDVAWGVGFVAVAATSLLLGTGDRTRSSVLLVVVALWGFRLATHIYLRSRGHGEDPRYAAIIARAPGNPHLHMLKRVYLSQAAILWFVSLPVQVAAYDDAAAGPLLWVGVAVWAVGLFFETVGDWQLTRFRSDPGSRGKVLDTGLWRYSRHPNYFGDALAWWGIFLVAADAGLPVWLTVLSPLVMTLLLAKGTGKPLLEKDIAERRPDYARYIERTSGFVPWPPKSADRPR